jgi:hypothetical protein
MDLPAKFQPSLARRNFEEILIGRNFNSCVHLLLEKRQQSIFSLIIPFNPFPKKANNPPKRSHGSVLDLILAKLLDRTFKSIPVSHFRKKHLMLVKQLYTTHLGMVTIPPIKMVMTGGWCVYGIVLPTLHW